MAYLTAIVATDVTAAPFSEGLRLAFGPFQIVYSIIKATIFGAAIAFFPADNLGTIVLGLLGRLTGQHFWLDLTSYLLGPNLNVLQQVLEPDHQPATAFARPLVPVHGTHALLLIGAYALVFLAVSLILTRRRDVLQ